MKVGLNVGIAVSMAAHVRDTDLMRQSAKPTSTDFSGAIDIQRGNPTRGTPLTMLPMPDATWEQRALCYFFDQYTITGDVEDGMSHLEYLPPLYARCGETGDRGLSSICLRQAVDATSLMTLANVSNAPPLMMKARQGYGKALRSLRDALAEPETAIKDETFASVVLLSLLEDITGERNGLYSSHTAGFEFLMQMRGAGQRDHQMGRDMFNFAFTHTFVEILALGDKPRFDIDWVLSQLDNNDPIERLMLAASKLSNLFLAMQSSPKPPDQSIVESWISAGRECDFELAQWTLHLPERWLPLVVYSSQGEPLITYNRISNAVIWNYYRAVRVMLQQLLLNLNRTLLAIVKKKAKLGGSPSTQCALNEGSLRAIIQEMTTDVCRSIPFSLGDVDSLGRPTRPNESGRTIRAAQGYGLLWPLWYILSCGMPTPAQVIQIRAVLSRVGSKLGIRLALILAREAERIRGDPSSARAPVIGPE
ncbi:hypothetical protein N7532_000701 [Penicillium argentinense]|uniref:Uncharacterized protein n=1 Tax=Penicillium argentinense TaxID=1131581 RepID=A0A9W9G5Y8_9EURO|nr:uncharacterized protein N7532_000701 [Penicillium argentinense]KAJ5112656.1 hypothetical protein N7532_000701 [Penicillium argentinense]